MKEKLDDSFLRRSKRILEKLAGYKDVESTKKAKQPIAKVVEDVDEPMPLATIPPSHEVAPHLPKEILEGMQ